MTKLKKLAIVAMSGVMMTTALAFNASASTCKDTSTNAETSVSVSSTCSKHGYMAYKSTDNGMPCVRCGNCGKVMYYL